VRVSFAKTAREDPHPDPLPEYRERGKNEHRALSNQRSVASGAERSAIFRTEDALRSASPLLSVRKTLSVVRDSVRSEQACRLTDLGRQ
jgi:hypothetical protein